MSVSPVTPQVQAAAFIQQATTLQRTIGRSPDTDRARERCDGITTAFTKTMASLGDAPEHTDLRGRVTDAYTAVMTQAENSVPSNLRGLRGIIHGIYERAINPQQPVAAPAPAAPAQAPAAAPAPAPIVAELPAAPAPAVAPLQPILAPAPIVAEPAAPAPQRAPSPPVPAFVQQLLPPADDANDAALAAALQAALHEAEAPPVAEADPALAAAIRASLQQPAARPAPAVARRPTPPVADADEAAVLAAALALSLQEQPRTIYVQKDVGFGNKVALFGEGRITMDGREVDLSWTQGIDLIPEEANVWALAFTHLNAIQYKMVIIGQDGSKRWEVGTVNRSLTAVNTDEYILLENLAFGEPQRA